MLAQLLLHFPSPLYVIFYEAGRAGVKRNTIVSMKCHMTDSFESARAVTITFKMATPRGGPKAFGYPHQGEFYHFKNAYDLNEHICTCGYTVKVFSRQAVDLPSLVFGWAFTINLFHRGIGFIQPFYQPFQFAVTMEGVSP